MSRRLTFAGVPVILLVVGAVAGIVILASSSGGAAGPPPAGGSVRPGPAQLSTSGRGPQPPDTVWIGAWSKPDVATQAGRIAAVQSFEERIGRKLDLVHTFHTWDDPFPSPADEALAADGRVLMVSWAGADTRMITSGFYDDQIRQQAQAVRAFGQPMLLRWRWEMDRPNLQASIWSPEDFIAAWDHVRSIFAEEGATNAGWVWCPLATGFADGRAQKYYPGDSEVDWICADVYPSRDDRSFADVSAPFLDWAAGHDRPIVIGEFGAEVKDGDDAFQGSWLTGAEGVLARAGQVRALAYFEGKRSADEETGDHAFDFTLAPDSPGLTAFERLAADLSKRTRADVVAQASRAP